MMSELKTLVGDSGSKESGVPKYLSRMYISLQCRQVCTSVKTHNRVQMFAYRLILCVLHMHTRCKRKHANMIVTRTK